MRFFLRDSGRLISSMTQYEVWYSIISFMSGAYLFRKEYFYSTIDDALHNKGTKKKT